MAVPAMLAFLVSRVGNFREIVTENSRRAQYVPRRGSYPLLRDRHQEARGLGVSGNIFAPLIY